MSRIVSAPFFLIKRQDLSQICLADRTEPPVTFTPVALHGGDEKAQILRRHVGQGVRPVFEDALVDALGLSQMLAPIGGDARPENVMVAALDDIDGVDLHVAQMLHRRARRLRPVTKGRGGVEPLGM